MESLNLQDAPRFDYRLFKNHLKMSRSYRSVTVNLRRFLLSKSDAEKGGTTYVRHKDIPGTGGFVHEIPRLPRGHDYFIVVLYPPPDLEDEEFDGSEGGVDLLFDVNSLYYLGFSDAEYWRLFEDAVLPGVTEESEAAMNIKRLHIKGSYQGIGQEYEDLIIGFEGQLETYKVLTNLRRENQARVERVSCRNIVTVSESMRFPFLQKLHLTAFEMGLEKAAMDYPVMAGEEYRNPSAHLNDWSNYSGKCSEGEDKFLAELRIQPIPGITSFECLLNFVSFLTNKEHEKAHRTEHSEKKSKNAIANRDGDKKGDGKKDPENEKDGRKQREKNNSSSTWFFESPVMPYRWISRYACLTQMVLPNKYAAVKFAQEFGIKVCSDLSLVPARVLPLPMLRYHNSGRQRTSVPSVGQWKMINKGKSEQMIEYIKKLRACIKWLLEREDANLAEIGKLTDPIDAAEKHHTESVAQLESRIEESLAIKEELQKQYAYLEENLKKLEAEKVDLLRSYGDEKEARTAVESSRNELNRVKLDKKRLNDQIKMLQDTNKRLQEYNTSLQQYNCNVQADAMKNDETIAKLQKEKNTMVDTMNSLKDHANSVKMQLDLAKQVREDRDHKSAEINSLLSDLSAHKELTGKTSMEIENILTRCGALEETCSTQTERIKTLEIQLASANEKLKVCIFAYGQTGCGKTHTMMGNPEVHDQKGLIPRWLEQAFQTSQCLISQGWKYKMKAPMFEICNETIHDLLVTNRTSVQDGAASKYNIKHDDNGNTQASELTVFDVRSINEVSSLLKRATQSRSVAKTQLNEESSRSHCVFTLRIFGVNEGTDQPMQGVVNLIDLASSERLNKSGATGDRLKEIQPCLGGDSKTLCL